MPFPQYRVRTSSANARRSGTSSPGSAASSASSFAPAGTPLSSSSVRARSIVDKDIVIALDSPKDRKVLHRFRPTPPSPAQTAECQKSGTFPATCASRRRDTTDRSAPQRSTRSTPAIGRRSCRQRPSVSSAWFKHPRRRPTTTIASKRADAATSPRCSRCVQRNHDAAGALDDERAADGGERVRELGRPYGCARSERGRPGIGGFLESAAAPYAARRQDRRRARRRRGRPGRARFARA